MGGLLYIEWLHHHISVFTSVFDLNQKKGSLIQLINLIGWICKKEAIQRVWDMFWGIRNKNLWNLLKMVFTSKNIYDTNQNACPALSL